MNSSTYSQQLNQLKFEKQIMQEQIDKLQNTLRQKDDLLNGSQFLKQFGPSSFELDNRSLKEQNQQFSSKIIALQSELGAKLQLIANLNQQVNGVGSAAKQLQTVQYENKVLQQQLIPLQQQLLRLQNELDQKNTFIGSQSQQLSNLEAKIEQVNTQLEESTALNVNSNHLRGELSRLEIQCQQKNDEIKYLTDQITASSQIQLDKDAQIFNLKREVELAKQQLALNGGYKQQVLDRDAMINQLQDKQFRQEKDSLKQQAEYEELRQMIEQQQEKFQLLLAGERQKNDDQARKISELKTLVIQVDDKWKADKVRLKKVDEDKKIKLTQSKEELKQKRKQEILKLKSII